MATTTTNLGLVKPSYTETADISVINSNFDTIDSAIGTLQGSFGELQDHVIVQGDYCYTVGSWSGGFDWNLNCGTSGQTLYAKHRAFASVSFSWLDLAITVNGSVITERTHSSSYRFGYGDSASEMPSVYGANSDGDFKLTASIMPKSDNTSAYHVESGPYAGSRYYVCIKGVNDYDGCYAWLQFEIYASGGTPQGLYSLGDMQQYARMLG